MSRVLMVNEGTAWPAEEGRVASSMPCVILKELAGLKAACLPILDLRVDFLPKGVDSLGQRE